MAPSQVVPVMVEAEFYAEDTADFRMSLRAPPSNKLLVSLVNMLNLYFK